MHNHEGRLAANQHNTHTYISHLLVYRVCAPQPHYYSIQIAPAPRYSWLSSVTHEIIQCPPNDSTRSRQSPVPVPARSLSYHFFVVLFYFRRHPIALAINCRRSAPTLPRIHLSNWPLLLLLLLAGKAPSIIARSNGSARTHHPTGTPRHDLANSTITNLLHFSEL